MVKRVPQTVALPKSIGPHVLDHCYITLYGKKEGHGVCGIINPTCMQGQPVVYNSHHDSNPVLLDWSAALESRDFQRFVPFEVVSVRRFPVYISLPPLSPERLERLNSKIDRIRVAVFGYTGTH
jgi:hypothetical protein